MSCRPLILVLAFAGCLGPQAVSPNTADEMVAAPYLLPFWNDASPTQALTVTAASSNFTLARTATIAVTNEADRELRFAGTACGLHLARRGTDGWELYALHSRNQNEILTPVAAGAECVADVQGSEFIAQNEGIWGSVAANDAQHRLVSVAFANESHKNLYYGWIETRLRD